MNKTDKLFQDKGYIEGITIINVEGEILFSAKFNSKMNQNPVNYETVGKKFLEVYENLNEENSSTYRAMRNGAPVYVENQELVSTGKDPIYISSLSVPIKSGGAIVGAIDLSVTSDSQETASGVEIKDEVLYAYHEVDRLHRGEDRAVYSLEDIQTCDPQMMELKENIKRFAQSDLPVMIYGETGTGKELVAHAIHQCSSRSERPFVVQNCASIPANLIESILFGTSKGAFTGAVDNQGLLELADGGTLFLDEINSMPMELQPKILRVIQDGTFRRVGGKKVHHVNVRILSSTNEKPQNLLSANRFRQDLYYRLAVLVLEIPGLRERKKDIPLLTNYFIGRYCRMFDRKIRKVSPDVYRAMEIYHWPGNVRELESMVASAVCMADKQTELLELRQFAGRLDCSANMKAAGEMDPEENSGLETILQNNGTLNEMVSAYEKTLIQKVLSACGGNITRAAQQLQVPRQTLSRKVREHKLSDAHK